MTTGIASLPKLALVARALHTQAEVSRLARELDRLGIPLLLLKGPWLQQRLYGTPAAYESGDVDLLVPRARARDARRALLHTGWRFGRENGVLWLLSAAGSYERNGVRVDLHWGVHAAHLPSWALRPLERALWVGARSGPVGLLEPDAESLLVFLAVHAVGHGFGRDPWTRNVIACARLVNDWSRVWRLGDEARVGRAVMAALSWDRSTRPVLQGAAGRVIWRATWLARGHFLPRFVRDAVRRAIAPARAVISSRQTV